MKVEPQMPPGCKVFGSLYTAQDPRALSEDMFEAALPNGVLVAAGWVPQGDPTGSYEVAVTRGLDDVVPPFHTQDIEAAREHIEKVADLLTSAQLPAPST